MTMTKARAKSEFTRQLDELQEKLWQEGVDKSLPKDWNALDHWHPVTPKKERVTIRLDADMVRWFRSLGPGYGVRMNMVLRLYWTGILSGELSCHYRDNSLPRLLIQANEILAGLTGEDPVRPRKA